MGPLWAWVLLWLVSAYGLVLLLRIATARSAVEPVPVLVATPPASPAPPDPAAEPAAEMTADVPAEPEGIAAEADAEPVPALDGTSEDPVARTAVLPQEGPEAGTSEPWIKEREIAEASEPWIQEKPESGFDEPWIKEKEGHEASAPWSEEADEPLPVSSMGETDEDETVEYRSIDLESLTLGLEAAEIQELYGSPGHVSKLGSDGEQWRYPLNATDDHGEGLSGVLVLEFQRGRLVRKALEEAGAQDG